MQKPIADVFTWPSEEPKLIGAKCSTCAAVTFPSQSRCPRCSTTTMEDLELPTRRLQGGRVDRAERRDLGDRRGLLETARDRAAHRRDWDPVAVVAREAIKQV